MPVASFSLAADQIANTRFEPFKVMVQFIVAFGAVTTILLAICVLIIWRKSGRSLANSVASQEGPFFLAVATRNSASCMPSMLIAMVDKLGFDKAITELLVPLGTALFRVGPVLYYCMATVFIAQLYGRDLAATDYLLILFASLIAGFSSTGMNGIVTISQTTIVCSLLGLPFEAAFVLFVAVEPICDTFRTVLLVISINALVALITPLNQGEAADDAGIASKKTLPQTVSQDDLMLLADFVRVGKEEPPQQRLHAEHGKYVCAHLQSDDRFRLSCSTQVGSPGFSYTHRFERMVLTAPVEIVRRGDGVIAVVEDRHQAVGIAVGQGTQKHGVHHAEDRCVGANAER